MRFGRMMSVAGLVLLAVGILTGCKKGGSLDGKTFQIQVTEPGKPPQPDELIFAAGKLDSTECRKYGFAPAAYTVKKEGNAMSFTSEAKSEKEGTNRWTGKVEGDRVSGTLEWTKPGQATIKYTYAGTLAKK